MCVCMHVYVPYAFSRAATAIRGALDEGVEHLCAYMYVCVYECMHVWPQPSGESLVKGFHPCVRICMCACTYACMYGHMRMYVCMCLNMRAHNSVGQNWSPVCVATQSRMYVHIHAYVCMYLDMRAHNRVRQNWSPVCVATLRATPCAWLGGELKLWG